MFNKKTINDVDVQGKVILLRADYNVPIEYLESGSAKILNNYRIWGDQNRLKGLPI